MFDFLATKGFLYELLKTLVIPFGFALIIAAVFNIRARDRTQFWPLMLILTSVGLVGIIVGQLAGQTREAVLSALIPALLSLIGGCLAIIFAKDTGAARLLTAAGVIGLMFNLFVGLQLGSHARTEYEAYINSTDYKYKLMVEEAALQRLREQLKLGGEAKK